MGFITVVVLHNDAMGEFQADPKRFGETILKGIAQANMEYEEVAMPIGNHANYIHVHPSRHADDHTLFLNKGNCVTNLNAYDPAFQDLVRRLPEVAEEFLRTARNLIKSSAFYLKTHRTKKA